MNISFDLKVGWKEVETKEGLTGSSSELEMLEFLYDCEVNPDPDTPPTMRMCAKYSAIHLRNIKGVRESLLKDNLIELIPGTKSRWRLTPQGKELVL